MKAVTADPVAYAETAARLRVAVARLARQLRQHSPGRPVAVAVVGAGHGRGQAVRCGSATWPNARA